jgi:hypothetical protein
MKRRQLLRYLQDYDCEVSHEGGDHTHVRNNANGKRSVVARHREIEKRVVRTICKQLDIPPPKES